MNLSPGKSWKFPLCLRDGKQKVEMRQGQKTPEERWKEEKGERTEDRREGQMGAMQPLMTLPDRAVGD